MFFVDELREEEIESKKEESEFDKIVKDLKDIFKFVVLIEDYFELKEFSLNSSGYIFWYNNKDRIILLVKGNKLFFIENGEKVYKLVLFEFNGVN